MPHPARACARIGEGLRADWRGLARGLARACARIGVGDHGGRNAACPRNSHREVGMVPRWRMGILLKGRGTRGIRFLPRVGCRIL